MTETPNCLYNMSAPPRSQVTIAPHRASKMRALVYIPNFPSEQENWRQHILDWTYMRTWSDLLEALKKVEPTIPDICVVGGMGQDFKVTVAPVSTIAMLSRIIGNLYLKRTIAELSYHRLSRRVSISDRKVLNQLTTNPISSPT